MADLTRVIEVLVAHQRWSAGGCICGFRVASVSETADARDRAVAAHQAQMLADAGLVADGRRAQAEALREAANDAHRLGVVSGTLIDVGKRAGDWLRARADRIEAEA